MLTRLDRVFSSASLTIALFAAAEPAVANAAQNPVEGTISPSYIECLVSTAPCDSVGRLSLAGKYTLRLSPYQRFRVKIAREYQQATADDTGEGIVPVRASDLATDTINARLRSYDGTGALRNAVQVGYSYQHSTGVPPAYHTGYAFDDVFFGRRIERGNDGPARRFDLVVKVSENLYQAAASSPQSYVLLTPAVTFPLNPPGTWRANANYTFQEKFAGGGSLAPSSQRFTATVTHDFTSAIKAFVRFDSKISPNGATGRQSSNALVIGADFTIR